MSNWLGIPCIAACIVLLFVVIKSCDSEELIPFDLEAELQQCMDDSDHQFKVCVDAVLDANRPPND